MWRRSLLPGETPGGKEEGATCSHTGEMSPLDPPAAGWLLTHVPAEAALSTDGKRAARLPETGTPASFSTRAPIPGGAECRALLQKLFSLQEPPHIAAESILSVGANVPCLHSNMSRRVLGLPWPHLPCCFFQPKEL